ncbi:MAG TPA: hypothetical protein VIL78_07145 [Hanamia sp.]
MGKQTNIRLRCTVDNTIYYQWRDVDCIRTVPARVRQTAPTKKEASNFGVAVKYAAIARSMFRKIVPMVQPGRSWVYKTDSTFRNWLRTAPLGETGPANGIPFFDGLSFNEAVDFRRVMQVPVQISRGNNGSLVLQWPAFSPLATFKAPAGTHQVIVKYLAATLDMQQPGNYHEAKAGFTIPYTDTTIPAGTMLLENATAPGNLALVAMAIYYYKDDLKNAPVNMLRWKPAGIMASFYN